MPLDGNVPSTCRARRAEAQREQSKEQLWGDLGNLPGAPAQSAHHGRITTETIHLRPMSIHERALLVGIT